MTKEPTSEDVKKLAEETAKEEVINPEDFDLSLPDSAIIIDRMAQELLSNLTNLQLYRMSAAANATTGNAAEKERWEKQAAVATQMAARLQKQYPTARPRMLELLKEADAAKKRAG